MAKICSSDSSKIYCQGWREGRSKRGGDPVLQAARVAEKATKTLQRFERRQKQANKAKITVKGGGRAEATEEAKIYCTGCKGGGVDKRTARRSKRGQKQAK